MIKGLATLGLAAALVGGSATIAEAQSFIGLSGDRTLQRFTFDGGRVTDQFSVSGVPGKLLGFDRRTQTDGLLYGIFANGTIATINPSNGRATAVGTASERLPDPVSIDFNPVADAIRVVGQNGRNFRVNVTTGAVTTDAPITFPAVVPPAPPNQFNGDNPPQVVGVAYTNARPGVNATQLYDVEAETDATFLQTPPNNGTLSAVGQLALGIGGQVGFDIFSRSSGVTTAYLARTGRLYRIDLGSGRTIDNGRAIVNLNSGTRDIAVLTNP